MTSIPSWDAPPEKLILDTQDVHVWRASLELPAARIQSLANLLSADEQERADRFYFQKDRNHYIVARATLRLILSRYLDTQAREIRFRYGPKGKPDLKLNSDAKPLYFNISHSYELALYAVTCVGEIGIDVEHIHPGPARESIAERFFAPAEVDVLRSLPAHLQDEAFYTCWTRKEAYIKAVGEGLSLALDQFEVSLIPREPAVLLKTRPDAAEAARWWLHALTPGPDYVAALAVAGNPRKTICWQWSG